MKQQKNVPAPATSTELAISTKALSLKGEINALHRETMKSGNEMMQNAVACGELLEELKGVLKASKTTSFEIWVNQNLDFTDRAARSYCKLYQDLAKLTKPERRSVLESADSIAEARRLITAALPAPVEAIPISPPPASEKSQTEGYVDVIRATDDPLEFPVEDGPDVEPEQSAKKTKSSKPPVSGPDTQALYKEWDRAIGPLVRLVDRIAGQVNGKHGDHHKLIQEHLNVATEEMMEWMGVAK